jgi:hypothetical protein
MIVYLPNLIPGLSSRTFSRCSLAKNMYADRPRLGALGSAQQLALSLGNTMHTSDLPFFFFPPSALVALPLPRVTFSLGMMLVICDELHVVCQWLVEKHKMWVGSEPAESKVNVCAQVAG